MPTPSRCGVVRKGLLHGHITPQIGSAALPGGSLPHYRSWMANWIPRTATFSQICHSAQPRDSPELGDRGGTLLQPPGHPGWVRRYVLLPRRGLRWPPGATPPTGGRATGAPRGRHPGRTGARRHPGPAGPPGAVDTCRLGEDDLRVAPVRRYRPALVPARGAAPPRLEVAAASPFVVVVSADDGQPLAGATVSAFTDFAARQGARGRTRADGTAELDLGAAAMVRAALRARRGGPLERCCAGASRSAVRCGWPSGRSTTASPTAWLTATAWPACPPAVACGSR